MSMQQREPGHVSLKCFVIRKERIWFFKLRAEDKRSTFIIDYDKNAPITLEIRHVRPV